MTVAGVLGLAVVLSACADQANPTVPGSTGPGGTTSGGGSGDAGATADAAPTADGGGSPADQSVVVVGDAVLANCDLFAQQCGSLALGCYPVGGAGRCEPAGGVGSLGSCTADTDCVPGLVCVAMPGVGGFGNCQAICNLSDASSTACNYGYVCSLMPGFSRTSNVGRCVSA